MTGRRRIHGAEAVVETVEFCHKCEARTRWVYGRFIGRPRFSRCEGCGDRFPCASRCGHVDCERWRAELDTPASRVKASSAHDPECPCPECAEWRRVRSLPLP